MFLYKLVLLDSFCTETYMMLPDNKKLNHMACRENLKVCGGYQGGGGLVTDEFWEVNAVKG